MSLLSDCQKSTFRDQTVLYTKLPQAFVTRSNKKFEVQIHVLFRLSIDQLERAISNLVKTMTISHIVFELVFIVKTKLGDLYSCSIQLTIEIYLARVLVAIHESSLGNIHSVRYLCSR